MKRTPFPVTIATGAFVVLLGGIGFAAQDRYTVQVPGGLPFSEFRGYETWQDISVSQVKDGIKFIGGNAEMIKAYLDGAPGNGKPFPDGVKIVKIEWSQRQNKESPYFVMVPDKLMSVSFIEKDTKRFPNTHGWAYAQFLYDPATASFRANGTGAECGYACHTGVAAKDYIFTAYPQR
ncbi:MAG TPA: cytochrome P460 family protein [Rhizomicrobium sp.]|jgi:hypothetical protein|nr:cytochrome P460 family protein [Rhizomicrobium sp.]